MKTRMLWVAVLLSTVTLSGCVLTATPRRAYVVESAPPPPQEQGPSGHRRGYVWVEGRWDWIAGQWQWQEGHWKRQRRGQVWVNGFWEQRGHRYHWVDGRWDTGGGTVVHDHSTQPQPQPQPQPGPVVVNPNPRPGPVVVNPNPQPPPQRPQNPVVYTVNPATAPSGSQVRITGDFFGPEDYVMWGHTRLRTLSQSRTHFDVKIPVGIPAGNSAPISVRGPRGTVTAQQQFTVSN
jgi:hypothetical protein